jgi:hypothetical protein
MNYQLPLVKHELYKEAISPLHETLYPLPFRWESYSAKTASKIDEVEETILKVG